MKRSCFPFLLLLLLVAPGLLHAQLPPARSTLVVQIEGLRSDKGLAQVDLFRSREGFPRKPERALRRIGVPIQGGRASAVFDDLDPGSYAVSVFHDEDGDGKVTTNWIGMPKEGLGASNNKKGGWGPPDFEEARFELRSARTEITISIRYL
jgi:uncharacterized protein (DUF2141 family)